MNTLRMPSFPTGFELPNCETITIRLIQPSDAPLLVEMFHHLSERTRRLRFHAYTDHLPEERIWGEALAMSDLDPERQAALVAVCRHDGGEHVVGVARLARATAEAVEAEAAVVVRDDFQGMGLGSELLALLLPVAQSMGIKRLFGWIMSENRHMLHIIKKTDLPVHIENHSGEMFVVVSLPSGAPTPSVE